MDFRDGQAIYLQIVEYVCEQILLKHWLLNNKIISIRDLAVAMQVNPNTVQRAYDFLQQREIIANKRGVGYFIEEDAVERVIAIRKEQFIENELPLLLRNIYLLNIPIEDIAGLYKKFIDENFKTNGHETQESSI
jgi:DNA-binding transcriptional regulator YhcF (GntR family)